MADVFNGSNDMYNKLRAGQDIICPKCQKAMLKTFPESIKPNESYTFCCSNNKCDWFVRYEPIIMVE